MSINWNKISDKAKDIVFDKFDEQGHTNTGETERTSYADFDGKSIRIYAESHMLILNDGVSAERIPYRRGSGASTSKYIEGLKRYARSKGMDNPDRAAFAIAASHSKEGMPTHASKRFSKTGKRTGFLQEAAKSALPQIAQMLALELKDEILLPLRKRA